jgi:hypothetical protein
MAGLHATGRRALIGTWPLRRSAAPILRVSVPVLRTLVAHVVALLATAIVLLADPVPDRLGAALGLAMLVALAGLRIRNVERRLATSTLILDAAGTALFMAGSGAPSSAYFFLAIAGAWWAAQLPGRHSGATWATAFLAVYVVLVVPGALADGTLVNAIEDVSVVVIIGVLSDWFVRVDARALALSDALANAPAGAEKVAIRDGLSRASSSLRRDRGSP